jgi:DNA-binding CsgD family transcriptional regulator
VPYLCVRAGAWYFFAVNAPTRPQARPPQWLARFGDRTAELVCAALAAEWGVFFLLDETATAYGFRSRGAPADLPLSYAAQDIERNDPLHPRRLTSERRRFATIFDPALVASPARRRDQQRFWGFLQSFGARDAAEMIFWNGRRAVGGMSLIWRDKTSRCRDRGLALSLQSYIEFNLVGAFAEPPTLHPTAMNTGLETLTEREQQVAELVCHGCTNSEISSLLGVTLATVKTHLIHIFGKLEVNNRVALARCMVARSSYILSRFPA